MNNLSERLWRRLAWLWLAVIVLVSGQVGWLIAAQQLHLDTDIMALLPHDRRDAVGEAALHRMAAAGEQRVVVLVGARDTAEAERGGDAYITALQGLPLRVRHHVAAQELGQWRQFFAARRDVLLSTAQRAALQNTSAEAWQQRALQQLASPAPAAGLSWRDDPFGWFNQWLLEQAAEQRVRLNDGRLWLSGDGREWAVILIDLNTSALAMSTHERVMPALQRGAAAARAVGADVQVVQGGVLLFASAAASQAQEEMSVIGLGSTLGVVVLVLLVFRRPRPLVLALLPIVTGTILAVAVTWMVCGGLHALTLVFGASLVGVAEDYGIHYLCMGYDDREFRPVERMRRLIPGLLLAMATTVVAYGGLALTPFPGLRQMALFAGVGLVGAWLTAVLWLPWITRPLPPLAGPALRLARSRPAWSRLLHGRSGRLIMVLIAAVLLLGLPQVRLHDDLRLLQNAPPALLADQQRISTLLAVPGPGQFFTVRGASVDEVLQREEHLTQQLDALVAQGVFAGYQAISAHVPSAARQRDNRRLQHDLKQAALPALADTVGADPDWIARQLRPSAGITLNDWLQSPVAEGARHLWLGQVDGQYASVVALRGVHGQAALTRLAAVTGPGIGWTDKPAQISALMSHYRNMMAIVLMISFVIVWGLLYRRYGPRSWRGLAPTALACLLTLALLGLAGQPVQLFTLLGLFLVLGMGEDYGIFMLEHPHPDAGATWLAVSLAAVTTLLSFGLLAFSHTPALQAFGLATGLGITFSWLLAPAFGAPVSGDSDVSHV